MASTFDREPSGQSRPGDSLRDLHGSSPDDDDLAAARALAVSAPGDETGRELTAAEVAALARLDDGPDSPGDARDGEPGPPPQWPSLPDEDHEDLLRGDMPGVSEALDAGFTHCLGGTGTGFSAGGPVDAMLPGSELAWHAGMARRAGLGVLSDDELCGVLAAARRLGSWQAELELAAVTELDTRRAAPDGCPGEHVAEEIAAVLKLTGRSADTLLGLSRNLRRLPATAALLAAGIIDRACADIIASRLALLSAADAAAADAVLPRAAGMTTGRLAAAVEHAIAAQDPRAAIRRRKQAEKEARVECWPEPAGTAAIAGRDLAPAGVIAADKTLDADARWLKAHGVPGSHDQLRAAAMLAGLTGQPLASLLPQPTPGTSSSAAATPPAPVTGGWPGAAGWPAGLGGSVNLTVPAATWLGLAGAPGEIAGNGTADAGTCRDLANALAGSPATRWCVTVVDDHGRAVAHGCARAGPGPPPAPVPSPGSPASPPARSKPGTAATGGNPPHTSHRTPCATSSRSAAAGAGSPAADGPPWPATTTTPSPTTKAAAPANATCTPSAAVTTRPSKPPDGGLTSHTPANSPGPSPAAGPAPSPPSPTRSDPRG